MRETFYKGLARHYIECQDSEHGILFLTVGCTGIDTPKLLLKALACANVYLALKNRNKIDYKDDAWDLYLESIKLAEEYLND